MTDSSKIKLVINPNGSVRRGEEINFTLMLDNQLGFVESEHAKVFSFRKDQECEIIQLCYQKTINHISYFTGRMLTKEIGVHYFFVSLSLNQQPFFIRLKDGEAVLSSKIANKEVNLAQDYWRTTVYDEKLTVPDWAKGKTMYHIFLDRFYQSNSVDFPKMKNRILHEDWYEEPIWKPDEQGEIGNNDFFRGNLKGIEEKLDYIHNMGFDILYISPIFWSQSNHRYDTSDYEKVDPYAGCNKDLTELCKQAHKRGMYIVLDAVFNHTGNDSKYFNEYGNFETLGAFQSKESPYYKWYKKNDKNEFEKWWGFKNLPVLNPKEPEVIKYFYGEGGIVDQWFDLGIDGIRIDVADELPDWEIGLIHQAARRNKPDAFIIGEVWENAILKEKDGKQRTYLLRENGLHSTMNYPFTDAILKYVRFGDYQYLADTYEEILHDYPEPCIPILMNSLSTHDITRAITTLAGDGIEYNKYQWTWDIGNSDRWWKHKHDKLTQQQYELGVARFRLATIIQMASPGIPCVFYGDEIGMHGYGDPFNRKPYNWRNPDEELRGFMVWIIFMMKKYGFMESSTNPIKRGNDQLLVLELSSASQKMQIWLNRTEKPIRIEVKEKYQEIFYLNSTKEEIGAYGAMFMIQ